MPFIPSGSFFNNWMNLVIYLPVGYWLYLYSKIKKDRSLMISFSHNKKINYLKLFLIMGFLISWILFLLIQKN